MQLQLYIGMRVPPRQQVTIQQNACVPDVSWCSALRSDGAAKPGGHACVLCSLKLPDGMLSNALCHGVIKLHTAIKMYEVHHKILANVGFADLLAPSKKTLTVSCAHLIRLPGQ